MRSCSLRLLANAGACLLLAGGSCVGGDPARVEGPVALSIDAAAQAASAPRDLLVAIAAVEGGLRLAPRRTVRADDHVPVAGVLELRHGAFDSLRRGAELLGTDEKTLQEQTARGTEAGARVLAELGAQTGARAIADDGDYESWRPAVATLSGLGATPYRDDYVRRVFLTLRDGGDHLAFAGERVHAPAHPGVAVPDGTIRAREDTPDYPGAIWFTTDCTNKCNTNRPDGNAAVDTIVIHDTEGGWDASVATLQFDAGKSVHYIVDADGGRVGQFVPETYTAWHAGNYDYNKHSVGIEHVGFASDPAGYSDGLYETSVKLVQSIRTRWQVPLDRAHIVGHYQVPNGNLIPESSPPCSDQLDTCEHSSDYGGAGNHRDPGENWQWCQYMQRLGGSCECADAWNLWNCTTDHTEAVRCSNGTVEIQQCYPCESMPIGTDDVCHAMAAADDMATAPDDAASSDDAGLRNDAATQHTDAALPQGDGGTAKAPGGCQCAVTVGRSAGDGPRGGVLAAGLLLLGLLVRRSKRRR